MVDRTRIRPMHRDPMSSALMEDHHPTKKSRDSCHQWADSVPTSGIKSLMEIDTMQGEMTSDFNPCQQQYFDYEADNAEPEPQCVPTVTPLLEMDFMGSQNQPFLRQQQQQHHHSGVGSMSFMPPLQSPSFNSNFPMPLMTSFTSFRPLPSHNPQLTPLTQPRPDGSIPSLLDLPIGLGTVATSDEPQAAREMEFEMLIEKMVSSVKTRLPMCCVTPVKVLESLLQRCKLPRCVRKYKQLEKGLPILCKIYVNDLLVGVGVGNTNRDADIQAYTRALKLLRETAFEDILFGRPLREEITDLMANLSQPTAPSPSSHRRFVVLEDRKPGEGSNSYKILALSAEFSGRKISLTCAEDNGKYCAKFMLDDSEISRCVGDDETLVRRNTADQALSTLKASCPVIKIVGNNESWRYEIKKNLKAKMTDKAENLDNYISKQRKYDEAIIVSTSELGLKFTISVTPANDLEESFNHILDLYVQSGSASPLIVAPLPARSQRLLLYRLARQRGLCTESIRLSANFNNELCLVPVIRRRLEASVLLPVVEKADGNCTEQFRLVTGADEGDDIRDEM